MTRLRRVKNSSGFEHRGADIIKFRIKRIWCWIVGHEEVGVYSWISYCQRCYLGFDPSEGDYWDDEE